LDFGKTGREEVRQLIPVDRCLTSGTQVHSFIKTNIWKLRSTFIVCKKEKGLKYML
jgi:hypothetical protein